MGSGHVVVWMQITCQPSGCFVPNVSSACVLSPLHISSKIFFLVTVTVFNIFVFIFSV